MTELPAEMRSLSPRESSRASAWAHYGLVGAIGLCLLLVSQPFTPKGPVLSDEVVYAVVARNLLEQGTLETHLYRADSIAKRGYPTRDYHFPGYMGVLAAAMALFGVNDFALALPSQLAYLAAGLILLHAARRLYGPRQALLAPVLFYAYPMAFAYANLIMAENVLALTMAIWLTCWLRLSGARSPTFRDGIVLAALLIVGTTLRPTFLALVPPTLFLFASTQGSRSRYGSLGAFGFLLVGLLFGIVWPLAQDRAYYPAAFDRAMAAGEWAETLGILLHNAIEGLGSTFDVSAVERPLALVHLVLGGVTLAALRLQNSAQRRLGFLSVYAFWVPVVVLTVLYEPVVRPNVARSLAIFVLPSLLLLPGLLGLLRDWRARGCAIGVTVALFGYASFHFTEQLLIPQQKLAIARDQIAADVIERDLEPFGAEVILYKMAFRHAWDHYPTKIIWRPPQDDAEFQALAERVRVDGIVVKAGAADRMQSALDRGLLQEPFVLISAGPTGRLVFLRKALFERRGGERAPAE